MKLKSVFVFIIFNIDYVAIMQLLIRSPPFSIPLHKFNSDKSMTMKMHRFSISSAPNEHFVTAVYYCIKLVESPRCVYQSRQKYFFKVSLFHHVKTKFYICFD